MQVTWQSPLREEVQAREHDEFVQCATTLSMWTLEICLESGGFSLWHDL